MDKPEEAIGIMFLDSGAHALYNKHELNPGYFDSEEFYAYVDSYCNYVKEKKAGIEHFTNVDVIFDPERTWKVQKYIENEHGLKPVPVIHFGTKLKWLDRYLNDGHDYIGLGGLGQQVNASQYCGWADMVYKHICPAWNDYKPIVRTHGFAMTAHRLLMRYPWRSVDSSSWVKIGAIGQIIVPRMLKGEPVFKLPPLVIKISNESQKHPHHFNNLSKRDQENVYVWLESIGIPFSDQSKKTVFNHYAPRVQANQHYFIQWKASRPKWPWSFRPCEGNDQQYGEPTRTMKVAWVIGDKTGADQLEMERNKLRKRFNI